MRICSVDGYTRVVLVTLSKGGIYFYYKTKLRYVDQVPLHNPTPRTHAGFLPALAYMFPCTVITKIQQRESKMCSTNANASLNLALNLKIDAGLSRSTHQHSHSITQFIPELRLQTAPTLTLGVLRVGFDFKITHAFGINA